MRISDWSSDVFSSDLLDLRVGRLLRKADRVEPAVGGPAAEIAAADFPDQVAAMLAMIGADRTFAGIMRESAQLRALVQRLNGVGAQGAKAHGGNFDDRRPIGRGEIGSASGRERGGKYE